MLQAKNKSDDGPGSSKLLYDFRPIPASVHHVLYTTVFDILPIARK